MIAVEHVHYAEVAREDAKSLASKKGEWLVAAAERQRKALIELVERAEYHEHRAKHWDLIANRRARRR
jgi:hypothetical protein